MSFWNSLIGAKISKTNRSQVSYAIIDIEVGVTDLVIRDIGALKNDGSKFHNKSKSELFEFLNGIDYVCGHNIINHDAKYLFKDASCPWCLVDTLYLSPLLFPNRPYHRLVKDDKLIIDQLNNPLNDCEKAHDLLLDEMSEWDSLPEKKRLLLSSLLKGQKEFDGFLRLVNAKDSHRSIPSLINEIYAGKICINADINSLAQNYPVGLAYALALIDTPDDHSITPLWVTINYPEVEYIIGQLCHTNCHKQCSYCNSEYNGRSGLKKYFGYDNFRTYEGEPLQERAVQAALQGQSLLAIFPTGGGKSLTFQLPALMSGRSAHGLTVVISPLQSLMKDQVDKLAERDINDAVTINGLLDPITRSQYLQKVKDGDASIIYLAPEMLRSNTIERILLSRYIVRFVIDEAHCFSSWGQDFRVDYLYIAKFIQKYQQKKKLIAPIPISCFTATAKPKVIQDICDYFKQSLNQDLVLFASSASRTNLQYAVIHTDNDKEKYHRLRELIASTPCPTIVYVSRTLRSKELAEKLSRDGYKALSYNGKMKPDAKTDAQNAFMKGEAQIIVATSAFGMGVDKNNVGMVIHYDISDSLENYVQEAGRAGRDPNLSARCYVLYSDTDLDKHFILLNQTKLSINDIQQVWKAIKELTKQRNAVDCSALEIARTAGWNDSVPEIETRVRTAIAALEQSGFIERGNNMPHIFATGITVGNMDEASEIIAASNLFGAKERETATRIIKLLISQKYISKAQDAEAESRVDYLADILGISKKEVISIVERMRQEGILADSKDISAYLPDKISGRNKSLSILEHFLELERFILNNNLADDTPQWSKQLNDKAINEGISSTEKDIKTLRNFLYGQRYQINNKIEDTKLAHQRFEKRERISRFILNYLFDSALNQQEKALKTIQFSVVELFNQLNNSSHNSELDSIRLEDVEESLYYLSVISSIKLEGGFLVIYNAMNIKRLKDAKARYKVDDYRILNEFYKLKIQQVHIVGEYANLMVKDYSAALLYVQDYFQMDYKRFINKYFKGERLAEIQQNISPQKYEQIFGQLSKRQLEIISDRESSCIVVGAGPGSGKTRVLVRKLASLLLLEDVKHEQLLMLTFSRAAATEFKQRLLQLVGNAAHYVDIKTFHSYSFDIMGRIGKLEDANNIVEMAADLIERADVEPNKIAKTVLVIDEAQDMGYAEYRLVKALQNKNEDMRVIAVGDDDQNIYEFRGSKSTYMYNLSKADNGIFVEMTDNFRSAKHIVTFANAFLRQLDNRLKTTKLSSARNEDGTVEITYYQSDYMYQPLVSNLLSNKKNGTSCVLTQTNEEALIIMALLRKKGVNCKLIQTLEGIRFWNLAEMRYFVKLLSNNVNAQKISDDIWIDAKQKTLQFYQNSNSIDYVRRCIEIFEQTNQHKYYNDFKEFVFESSVEDFCDVSGAEVVVSTIHKAKGKEFEDVYMLISKGFEQSSQHMRQLFVGITRAKNRLFIHTNSNSFPNEAADRVYYNSTQYTMPEEVVLQLSYKDVILDFFKDKKKDILALRSGYPLTFSDNSFFTIPGHKPIAILSQKMKRELSAWESRGYKVNGASVRFVVAWKAKDTQKVEAETAVLLPDLVLTR